MSNYDTIEYFSKYIAAAPEIVLLIGISIFLIYGAAITSSINNKENNKKTDNYTTGVVVIGNFTIILLVLALITLMYTPLNSAIDMHNYMYRFDIADLFAKVLVLLMSIICTIVSINYNRNSQVDAFEFFILKLLAVLCALVIISSTDFILLYIAMEGMSLCLYVLAGIKTNNQLSVDAGLKYFVTGSLASGIILFGISLVAGATGTFQFNRIALFLANYKSWSVIYTENAQLLHFGAVCIIVGLLFKLTIVPFHLWAPDVYEGAPAPSTLFIATIPKIAFFFMLCKLLSTPFYELQHIWKGLLVNLGLLSAVVGALMTLFQSRIKRLLAYSSVTHSGFMVVGLGLGTYNGIIATFVYLVIYIMMTATVWCILIAIRTEYARSDAFGNPVNFINFSDLNVLKKAQPNLVLVFCITFFSISGIPPLAGFFAKYAILEVLTKQCAYWEALVLVITTLISAIYYLRMIKTSFVDKGESKALPLSYYDAKATKMIIAFLIIINCILIFFYGDLVSTLTYYIGGVNEYSIIK